MKINPDSPLYRLMQEFPHPGRVEWIGLRPARRAAIVLVDSVIATAGSGLAGDRWSGRTGGRRQVTLIQREHLDAAAAYLRMAGIDPALVRRNIVVRGINLSALRDRRFHVGEAILEGSGDCHPCSRMELNLGRGGYNALRGHGGITARVVAGGTIRIGDVVDPVTAC